MNAPYLKWKIIEINLETYQSNCWVTIEWSFKFLTNDSLDTVACVCRLLVEFIQTVCECCCVTFVWEYYRKKNHTHMRGQNRTHIKTVVSRPAERILNKELYRFLLVHFERFNISTSIKTNTYHPVAGNLKKKNFFVGATQTHTQLYQTIGECF